MRNFDYYQTTEIRFGRGRIKEIGEAVARYGKRCLLVTGPAFSEIEPVYQKVKTCLKESHVIVNHFDKVIPNPTTEIVTEGAKMARRFDTDVVLGVGGGSSMDTAKAIAVEATHKGKAWDYLFFRETQPTENTLPIVEVTTTSGTGSHVTQVAVITNPSEKCKSAIFHSIIFPDVSIVDPDLMLTVPQNVTASSGFDVFAHSFESYINPNGSPYTDLMAEEAIRLVAEYLPRTIKDGADIEARIQLAWADTLAGLCIANAGVTLPHGIGMAIGGIYPHVMHGQALAAVYPAIMQYTFKSSVKKFADVARIFNPDLCAIKDEMAAEKSCDLIDEFLKKIGMWSSLEELKIPEDELESLAEASLVLPDYKNHPRVARFEEILDLLNKSHK